MHRLLVLIAFITMVGSVAQAANWPAYRGPNGDGSTPETGFPLHWSPTNNVRWRVDLPDSGNVTPIVWEDHVFVPQSISRTGQRLLLAFDRKTGRQLWQAGTFWEKREPTHEGNPYASPSPATDGKTIVVAFGSAGVWGFDFQGNILWRHDLGEQRHDWGYASSPVIHDGRAFLFHGPGPGSRLVAINLGDGKIDWQVELPEPDPKNRTDGFRGQEPGMIGTFSTPLVMNAGGRTEIVLSVPEELLAFAPDSGSLLWKSGGLNPLVYASPVAEGEVVLALGGFFGSSIAVRAGGFGDVTETRRLWHEERSRKNRLGTPVVKDGNAYFGTMEGFLECIEVATGKLVWEERLTGPGATQATWSSPTLSGDRIYLLNKSGDGLVFRASPKFEVLAINTVDEPLNASLAMAHGDLFIRTWKGLWCIGETQAPPWRTR